MGRESRGVRMQVVVGDMHEIKEGRGWIRLTRCIRQGFLEIFSGRGRGKKLKGACCGTTSKGGK